MAAPQVIHDLIERFERNRDAYHSGRYNETQLRREFVDPFFEALGWDVDNRQGYAEAYKEVVHEDAIRIKGQVRAPDYAFRIGGVRKFFVETKKPAVNVREDIDPAYQLRRYAWSAKLPLSILTDFEEFAVYDCRVKPDKADRASTARVLYMTYREYAERWEEIAGVFSKEAILRGDFDRFAESKRQKRGTAEVDDAFLAEIEGWRELLARNLALRNAALSQRELNFAVQLTIDRLVFLRICEDRGIEPYGQLRSLAEGRGVYDNLRVLFEQADQKYNSGLFHFHEERGREAPDRLTPGLKLDDEALKAITRRLYYPDSPYEFRVLPADILGQVYERFLGKVIRLTKGHRARVEEKPEVRKAGGVYYTPTYIVDYIVRNTVGRLLAGKTPKQAAELRILDPACGSGSFLIGAYQYLLDWHRDRYVEEGPERHARGRPPRLYQGQSGEWLLTIEEKQRILLDNIYGVDIDPQAVEVTKLSLLLKVLEGETGGSGPTQMILLSERRLLPDLGDNIKCGNSLIGPDFYRGQQTALFDEEEAYRINAFDWEAAFPAIMARGGFDAVIGNPPYIRIQALKEWAPVEVEYYKTRYRAASKGNYDIYVVFVEKGLDLLNAGGRLGFILPHKFFNAQYGEPLRELIAAGRYLDEVVHFGDQQVFSGATTYTCLLFLDKGGRDEFRFLKVNDLAAWRTQNGTGVEPSAPVVEGTVPAERATAAEWNFVVGRGADLFERLRQMPVKLGDVAERIAQGIRTSANEVYVLDLVAVEGDLITAHSKHLERDVVLERQAVALFLQGREIKPYRILPSGKVVIIPYRIENGHMVLLSQKEMREQYQHTFAYLLENKTHLEEREHGRMRGSDWYAYIYPKNIEIMEQTKILVPDIADRASFALDEDGEYAFTSGYGITLKDEVREAMKFVLGLLNSKVLDFYLKCISTPLRGGFFRYFTQFIELLPIRTIDFGDPADVERHERMVALVERMLELHKRLAAAQTPHERTVLQRQMEGTDAEIDGLVYELYGLTAEEIAVVEGAEKPR